MSGTRDRLLAFVEGGGEFPVEGILEGLSGPEAKAAVLEEAVLLAFERKKEPLLDRFLEVWLDEELPLGKWVELHAKVGWDKYWPRTLAGRLGKLFPSDPARADRLFFAAIGEPACREALRGKLGEILPGLPADRVLGILVRLVRERAGGELQRECFRVLLHHPQYPRFDPAAKAAWLSQVEAAGPCEGLLELVRALVLCCGGGEPATFRLGEEEAARLKDWMGRIGSGADLADVFGDLAMALRRSAAGPAAWRADFGRFAALLAGAGRAGFQVPYLWRASSGRFPEERRRGMAEVMAARLRAASRWADLEELAELADLFDYDECREVLGLVVEAVSTPGGVRRPDLLVGWAGLMKDLLMDKGGPERRLLVSRQVHDLMEPLERRLGRHG